MLEVVDSIDQEKWSEFVRDHPQGNIFQGAEIAEVFKNTRNYKPIVLAVKDDSTENIIASVLGVVIREADGILGQFSARSLIQGGPIFVDSEMGLKAASLLMQKYDEIAKKNAIYSEIRMLNEGHLLNNIFTRQGYHFIDYFNAQIDLRKSKEELWKQLKRNRKRDIKKAWAQNITIEECRQKDKIPIFYDILKETYNDNKIPLADISLFESVFKVLVPQNKAKLILAKYDEEYIAAQLPLLYNGTIYLWYIGTLRSMLPLGAGAMVIWHLLEWGSENGYEKFDFGGGGGPTKNIKLRRYKERFGSTFYDYGRYRKTYSPVTMGISKIGFEIYRRVVNSRGKQD